LKLATWNVNSLKVRLPHLADWTAVAQPDVVCLQETKLEDTAFPRADLETAGWHVAFAGQKTYNGVAILSRTPLADVAEGLPGYDDPQKRVLRATMADGLRVVCIYVPNGQAVDSEKYPYKLAWLDALAGCVEAELAAHPQFALLGDYNIAPTDADVHDPAAWAGQVLCTEPEREAFRRLIALGLVDSFRAFPQPERAWSWWDYRMLAFRRKMGLRIDHILLSASAMARCTACTIDATPRGWERPSDHAPVIATLV
jgi:exodeoxyribonuclease-3